VTAAVWLAWILVVALAVGVRLQNALGGPLMWGYDAWGHVAYALFIDLYHGLPWPDQGWSYFHPPLHYGIGAGLARFGDAEVLVRGLALWGSAASLGTATLAALLVRRQCPDSPGLAPLAFGAVALLPVHLFMSPMPGNEMTLTFLTALVLFAAIANERRAEPTRRGDALVGGLGGLALLTKFSGLLPLLTVAATILLRGGMARRSKGWAHALARVGIVFGVALLVAAPYYQRNLLAFGTPFQLSRGYPLVAQVERDQAPGLRRVRHYLAFPAAVFDRPDPQSAPLLRSVWGTVYANVWADVFRESDTDRSLTLPPRAGWLALAGLIPTALFALGALFALDAALRRRVERPWLTPLGIHTLLCFVAFAVFAWRVPIWSALKASYLLGLSLPFATFLCLGVQELSSRAGVGARNVAFAALALVGVAAAFEATEGVGFARRADAPATAAVRFYFGDSEGAKSVYQRLAAGAEYPVPWLDGLGAVALAENDPTTAARYYARAVRREGGRAHPLRVGQWAVAEALAADTDAARERLDREIGRYELPTLLHNRGVLTLLAGDSEAAAADLERALELDPELWLSWEVLILARGDSVSELRARVAAAEGACRVPRGHPYGLGTGEVLEWGVGRRALLRVQDGALELADLDYLRGACARYGGGS
jgi:tetratricopeptide (TPR) repeat protein